MERYDNNGNQQQGQDTTGVWSPSSSALQAVGVTAACSDSEAFSKNVPVFLGQTFKMIGQVPDDIICWSRAGDSFIIKQVLLLEEVLPYFYNHKNFMSFVRQLNFYGFKKMKGGNSPRSKSAGGARCGEAAAAALKEHESWEEYTHPQFRRDRPDLLVDITRKKDQGRSKRKRAESHQSDMLCTLATDVGTVSVDLKAVNNKIDSMMSMLLGMASSQRQVASANPVPQSENISRYAPVAGGGDVGVSSFASGGTGFANPAMPSTVPTQAATARGGLGQWNAVGGSGSGATHQGGDISYPHAAPGGYCVAPSFPAGQQQQGWQGHALTPQPPQQPYPARLYPALPNLRRLYTAPGGAISTTTAIKPTATARAPESDAIVGSSHQPQPPLHLPRPWFSDVPSSDGNEGGRIKNSCAVTPPNPGN